MTDTVSAKTLQASDQANVLNLSSNDLSQLQNNFNSALTNWIEAIIVEKEAIKTDDVILALKEDNNIWDFITKIERDFWEEFYVLIDKIKSAIYFILDDSDLEEVLRKKIEKIVFDFTQKHHIRLIELVGMWEKQLLSALEFFYRNIKDVGESLGTKDIEQIMKLLDKINSNHLDSDLNDIQISRLFWVIVQHEYFKDCVIEKSEVYWERNKLLLKRQYQFEQKDYDKIKDLIKCIAKEMWIDRKISIEIHSFEIRIKIRVRF